MRYVAEIETPGDYGFVEPKSRVERYLRQAAWGALPADAPVEEEEVTVKIRRISRPYKEAAEFSSVKAYA